MYQEATLTDISCFSSIGLYILDEGVQNREFDMPIVSRLFSPSSHPPLLSLVAQLFSYQKWEGKCNLFVKFFWKASYGTFGLLPQNAHRSLTIVPGSGSVTFGVVI